MAQQTNQLRIKWQNDKVTHPFKAQSVEGLDRVRLFHYDVDHDGQEHLCIQIGKNLLLVRDRNSCELHKEQFLLPYICAETGHCHAMKTEEERLCFIDHHGKTIAEHCFSQNKFGIGLAYQPIGSGIRFSKQEFGYQKKHAKILATEFVDINHDGTGEIVAFLSNGTLAVFDQNGRLLTQKLLLPGEFLDAHILFDRTWHTEKGHGIVVISGLRFSKPRWGIPGKYDGDWHAFIVNGLDSAHTLNDHQVITVVQEEDAVICVYGNKSYGSATRIHLHVDSADNEMHRMSKEAIDKQIFIRPAMGHGLLLATTDPRHGYLDIFEANDVFLWSQPLPPLDKGEYEIVGALGAVPGPAAEMIAVFCKSPRIVAGLNAEYEEFHLTVFTTTGEVLGEYTFPHGTEFNISTYPVTMLLDDIDRDGAVELLVFTEHGLTVFEVEATGHKKSVADSTVAGFSDRPRINPPAEDLWDGSTINGLWPDKK